MGFIGDFLASEIIYHIFKINFFFINCLIAIFKIGNHFFEMINFNCKIFILDDSIT